MYKKSFFILTVFLFSPLLLSGIEMVGLGDLPEGNFYSWAAGVNSDGSVVVGVSKSTSNHNEAFRWTQAGGMVGLGDLAGGSFYSNAYAVNSDGSVVVGFSKSTSNRIEAFRWTQAGGMVGLGDLAGGDFYSHATGVNSDGSVVVGSSKSTNNASEAFRWTQAGGMVGLGDLGGGYSNAIAVNSDGSVVVGRSLSASGSQAFRWTQAEEMVGLGDLDGGDFYSKATAVNSDGSVVVGNSKSTSNHTEAFRWTQAGGMVGLGDLDGGNFFSEATAVNSDGSVVVGHSESIGGNEAFRWTQETGMQSLTQWLEKSGYTLSGWSDTTASGVSDDGSVVVGSGISSNGYEAFIARGKSGLLGLKTLAMSLSSIANVNIQGMSILNTTMNGTHGRPGSKRGSDDKYTMHGTHGRPGSKRGSDDKYTMHGTHGRPGSKRGSDDKYTMWTAGDFAHNDRYETKDNFYLAEIGFGYRQNDNVRYSITYGQTTGTSKLLYEGKNKIDGYFFVIETDIKLPIKLPIYTTLSYMYGKNNLDIKRGYENAGSLDYSEAKTDQNMKAFKLRVQWQKEKDYIHPYVEYNYASVTTDAYTEINGGFPASFNKNKESTNDIRVGFDSNFKLNEKNRIITSLEGIHRMEKESNGISGTVIGFSSFHLAKETYKQNWIKATVGIESTFNVGKFTLTLNSTSKSADPQYWVGANYSLSF